jgi:hypothetical protein
VPSTTWFYFLVSNPEAGGSTISVPADTYTADDPDAVPDVASNIHYVQVGDVIFMTQFGYGVGQAPRTYAAGVLKLLREYQSSKKWQSYPYLPPEASGSSVTIEASATTGNITLTASASYFDSGHVGAFFKLSAAGSTGAVIVTGYTSATQLSATVLSTLPLGAGSPYGSAAGTSWEESAWSDYRGWPRTVTAFQGRLIYGGSKSYPDTIWGSRIGNVFDLMERPFEQDASYSGYTSDNSRPFTLTPNSPVGSNIVALSSAKTLLILTETAEIVGYGTQGALGPLDVSFESSTSFGADSVMPVRSNNFALFVEKGGRKLRDIIFSFNEDQYKSTDLSFLADHLTFDTEVSDRDPIIEIAAVRQNNSFVLARTLGGRLLGVSLDRDYQINAWFKFEIAGSAENVSYPLIKAMASAYNSATYSDRVFFIVQRRINGANVAQLEYMDLLRENKDTADIPVLDKMHADSLGYYSGAALSTVTGLSYIAGETVEVMALKVGETNVQYYGPMSVNSSGQLALGFSATVVIYGLKAPATIITMPLELGQQIPVGPQALIKRIDEVTIKFYNTYGAKYGPNVSSLIDINFKDPNALSSAAPVLFTGYKKLKFGGSYSEEVQVVIRQDKPWQCNVLGLIIKGQTYD